LFIIILVVIFFLVVCGRVEISYWSCRCCGDVCCSRRRSGSSIGNRANGGNCCKEEGNLCHERMDVEMLIWV
ncbi:hypothetical protein BKA69DRAFT_1069902, partial [Paraphysoderma sedebokerense]